MAHEKGLVHRDIKPSNVILTSEDHVYLTDFGLVKRVGTAAGLTAVDQMLGTVDYVAPEQIEGSEPGARGDVYSLACVLFEMLAGAPPFARPRRAGWRRCGLMSTPSRPPLREQRPEVPPALEDVIRRAMAKAPERRPTAAAFRAACSRAVGEPR